ncbi:MAG: SGNH/GDSL hydrolase family protein [Pyrinomonadaceae bacterium]
MLRVYLSLALACLLLGVSAFLVKQPKARRVLARLSYVVLLFLFVEAASVLALYVKFQRWPFNDRTDYLRQLYEPHPYLVAKARPNAHIIFRGITYSHNAQGFRGKDIPQKSGKLRVIAVGGSTTYGANVNDDQTWAAQLETLLGDRYEVLNFGMLGHSTAEHIGLLALSVPEYHPDVLLIHTGLNDLRNMHVRGLAPDYSDYHAPMLYHSLGLCRVSPVQSFASGRIAVWVFQRIGLLADCALPYDEPQEDPSPESEELAKGLYRRNLKTLVAIAEEHGVKPILVPQILVKESFEGGKLKWWIPLVEDRQLIDYMNQYNRVMEDVARGEGLRYVGEVLQQQWTKDDFADASHLNAAGNRKFATVLQNVIVNLREQDYHAPVKETKSTAKDSAGRQEGNRMFAQPVVKTTRRKVMAAPPV